MTITTVSASRAPPHRHPNGIRGASRPCLTTAWAGKGFGRKPAPEKPATPPPSEVDADPEAQAMRDTILRRRQDGVPGPGEGPGGSAWLSEVRSSEGPTYEPLNPRTPPTNPIKPPPAPATMPAEEYKKVDQNFVYALLFLGLGIFAEGLLVAGSGFLPESIDDFIAARIFPAFTPTLGVFLLVSVAYGLFKSKIEPK